MSNNIPVIYVYLGFTFLAREIDGERAFIK